MTHSSASSTIAPPSSTATISVEQQRAAAARQYKVDGGRAAREQGWLLVFGLLCVSAIAMFLYWPSTSVGFLLDDLLPPSLLWKAFNGDPGPFINLMFFGGSATADGLTCFRPGISLSFLLDYLCWGANGFGYHLNNVLAFAANCFLVGMNAWELAKVYRVRYPVPSAVAAAALFACYPLHVESTAWIIGRVDVLCTMFYLASTYAYMRFAERRSGWMLSASLVLFLAALTCKEMAVTLPLVLSLFVLTCSSTWEKRRSLVGSIGALWAALAGFAVLRTVMLGTVVGGYGSLDKHTFRQAVRNFADGATWWKVIFPATDEIAIAPQWAVPAVASSVLAALATVLAVVRNRRLVSLFVFLLGWAVVALLPTFQIWHIFPNMVGARLFFTSSAPICMLMAFAFFESCALVPFAALVVAAICGYWATLLQLDLQPWQRAGAMMNEALATIRSAAADVVGDDKIVVANLPADFKGAGLIGRPEYLSYMLEPPFTSRALASRVVTCERPTPGPNAFVFPAIFERALVSTAFAYIWKDERGGFYSFTPAHGASSVQAGWRVEPSGESSVVRVGEQVAADANGTRVFSSEPVNPMDVRAIRVLFREPASSVGEFHLVWSTPTAEWWQCQVPPAKIEGNVAWFVPSRLRTWTFAPTIDMVGLQGAANAHVLSVSSVDQATCMPDVNVAARVVKFDASAIPGAESVRVYVAKRGETFSDLATEQVPPEALVAYSCELPDSKGEVAIPATATTGGALRAVCVQALDAEHNPVGFLSEVDIIKN